VDSCWKVAEARTWVHCPPRFCFVAATMVSANFLEPCTPA
jgi:hypothetical protein